MEFCPENLPNRPILGREQNRLERRSANVEIKYGETEGIPFERGKRIPLDALTGGRIGVANPWTTKPLAAFLSGW
jgi:hypothetical protein